MTTVAQLLDVKGHDIVSADPDESVYTALERMAERGVGALLVLENGRIVGVISERDYARKVILQGKASKDTRVREIMTTDVICVRPEASVDECMALMTEERMRHLPVLENGKLIGLVSIGDVVKTIINEKNFTIEQLEHYICNG